jgi:hypothetical protein
VPPLAEGPFLLTSVVGPQARFIVLDGIDGATHQRMTTNAMAAR